MIEAIFGSGERFDVRRVEGALRDGRCLDCGLVAERWPGGWRYCGLCTWSWRWARGRLVEIHKGEEPPALLSWERKL